MGGINAAEVVAVLSLGKTGPTFTIFDCLTWN